MFDKSNLIKSLAAALLGGALIAGPALAQKIGTGAHVGASNGAAPAPTAGGGPPAGSAGGNHANATIAAPRVNSSNAAPPARGSNYAYNGSGHHGDHHHHHHHGGAFAFGFYGGPYSDDYYNDWAYQPDCTLRHVRIYHHHHRYWVWRRYCD